MSGLLNEEESDIRPCSKSVDTSLEEIEKQIEAELSKYTFYLNSATWLWRY
jgi:hypothetical protein